MLGTIKSVDEGVNDNSARKLDYCDVIASRSVAGSVCPLVCHTAKLNSKLSYLQQLIWDQTQTNTRIEHLKTHASNPAVYAPNIVQSVRLHLFKYRGCDNAHWISKNKMAATAVL